MGKRANCQVSVELVVSDGEVAAPVGGRLYLPPSWTDDPARGLKEPQGQLEKCWLVVDWPPEAPEPYHGYLAHFHRPDP